MSEPEGTRTPGKVPDPCAPGSRLGPYQIVEPLGAGGMGAVYRAHDSRLRRDVALKVISPLLLRPDSVERFEREARAAAALNHPNILAVLDVSLDGRVPYVVSELLEGESLQARLDRGPLPYRKALDYAIQIAQALAAAHAKRIYHRDVKPGNVFLTSDGRVKLLDFGLVKLPPADKGDPSRQSATPQLSRPGSAFGTAGYMAPEQVLGEEVDQRSDLFSLGSVLYEMFTGAPAFQRPTAVETMSAVLRHEPADPLDLSPSLPPSAAAVVRRCLEKSPDERFQSARDLAFHLQQLAQSTTSSHALPPMPMRRRCLLVAAGLVAAALAGTLPWLLFRPRVVPVFEQLTFHRGRIGGARFSGEAIVYSQARGLEPPAVSLKLAASPEARALGYRAADIFAACAGELALSVRRRFVKGERMVGTLAVAPIGGGTPHEILENVEDADCDPESGDFVVARSKGLGAASELEYPVGHVIYRAVGSLHSPRLSRDRRHVAFLEDPVGLGTAGHVVIVDRQGKVVHSTREWASARGLAWSPDGGELWFTASDTRSNRSLRALRLNGRERLVFQGTGSLTIWDATADGRVLLSRESERAAVMGLPPGATVERDLSWFDNAGLAALSDDGRWLLFGDRFGMYLRRTDGAPAVKLGSLQGYPDDLSPDGKLVLATDLTAGKLFLAPTGPGTVREIAVPGVESFQGSLWFPDGRRLLINGRGPGRRLRSYVFDLPSGRPRPVTEEDTWGLAISPDGALVAATNLENPISLWPVEGGPSRVLRGSLPRERPANWSADGRSLWVFRRGEVPARIFSVEVATGRRSLWKTVEPPDAAGVYSIDQLKITPDGRSYFYSYRRTLSELYEVRGLR